MFLHRNASLLMLMLYNFEVGTNCCPAYYVGHVMYGQQQRYRHCESAKCMYTDSYCLYTKIVCTYFW